MYVDVHAHLTHEKFNSDRKEVILRAQSAGVRVVVNGLDPESNRQTLELAEEFAEVRAALGIYPVHAVNDLLPEDFPLTIPSFNINEELQFIEDQAKSGKLTAIGECGLDGYWLDENTFRQQEEVFVRLLDIAYHHGLPAIIHTRDREERAVEILRGHPLKRVNFHCFGGKVKLAEQCAAEGYWFSIPANATVNQAFQKMLRILPLEKILTETDCPYLPPRKGERNEPMNVVGTVKLLAESRGLTVQQAKDQIWKNSCELFGKSW